MAETEVTTLERRTTPLGTEPRCWSCGRLIRERTFWIDWIGGWPYQVCNNCDDDGYPYFGIQRHLYS